MLTFIQEIAGVTKEGAVKKIGVGKVGTSKKHNNCFITIFIEKIERGLYLGSMGGGLL